MTGKFLEWDSHFFKKQIYRIDIETVISQEDFTRILSETKADLFYLFSDCEQPHILKSGGKLVDEKVIYTKKCSDTQDEPGIIPFSGIVTKELIDLAFLSGNYSRFKLDLNLSSRFEEMYLLWLERSVNGQIADKVYIYKENNLILGFITVKTTGHSAVIGLIAVNEQHQGKKIGRKLINKVVNWAYNNMVTELNVATQLKNHNACRFYENCGFTIKSIDYIYHYYNIN